MGSNALQVASPLLYGAYRYGVKKPRQEAKAAQGRAEDANANAQTQTNIAEDERLRRLRLLQGGQQAGGLEASTGRRTLLGN